MKRTKPTESVEVEVEVEVATYTIYTNADRTRRVPKDFTDPGQAIREAQHLSALTGRPTEIDERTPLYELPYARITPRGVVEWCADPIQTQTALSPQKGGEGDTR